MLPVEALHEYADRLSPYDVTAYGLFGAAAVTLAIGLIRGRLRFLRSTPGALYVLATSALFVGWVPEPQRTAAWVAAGLCLLAQLLLRRRPDEGRVEPERSARRTSLAYLVVSLAVSAVVLFDNLGSYAGSLLVWESPVSRELGQAMLGDRGQLDFARDRLLWTDGLMSAGHTSLFYGPAAWVACSAMGFGAWALRLPSVLAALLSIVVAYLLGRRFFHPAVGAALAVLLAVSVSFLFYGRYGTSASGTLLSALIALCCTWLFLDHDKPRLWTIPLCALSLYLATLQYATSRLLVVVLLVLVLGTTVWQWRRLSWRRGVGCALILAAACGVWVIQARNDAAAHFHGARGEQFLNFLETRYYFKEFSGRDVVPSQATRFDKFELLYRVLERTIPQYQWFVSPQTDLNTQGILGTDPPRIPLYHASLLPFVVWGIGYSLLRLRSFKHLTLLAWVALATGPLLLTNRVDAHRIMLFVIPCLLWAALGVGEAARTLREGRVPVWMRHVFAVFLTLTILWNVVTLLFWGDPPKKTGCHVVARAIAEIPGPIVLGADVDHRDASLINLALLERARRDPTRRGVLMTDDLLRNVRDEAGRPACRRHADQVSRLLDSSTVLLAPAGKFRILGNILARRGAEVVRHTKDGFSFLEARGTDPADAARTDDAGGAVRIRPPEEWPGARVWLDQLKPTRVDQGFCKPQFGKTWYGSAIVMDGVTYKHGIGMHAWCELTYRVPEGAAAFEAVIGYCDGIRTRQPDVLASFEVLEENENRLFHSGPFAASTTPRHVRVSLEGVREITLVVTEGGDGRNHDHVNWAEAAFLMTPTTRPTRPRQSVTPSGAGSRPRPGAPGVRPVYRTKARPRPVRSRLAPIRR